MRARRVVIELLASRVDIALYSRGRRIAGRRLAVTLPTEAAAWVTEVRSLGKSIHRAVEELNAAGAPAVVLYRSPTQAVDLADVQVTSAHQACEAAKLGIFESLSYSQMSTVCSAMPVGRDQSGDQRKQHVIVAADRDDVVGAIAHLVQSAGLTFLAAAPIDAAVAAHLARRCLKSTSSQALLYIGEHSSMFLLMLDGKLMFARRIGFGIELLALSLTRPMRINDHDTPITLDVCTTRTMVHDLGFPDRDAVVHQETGLHGAQVLPVMQPMLQRFLVELRQSLRFGLTEERRDGVTVICTGPGSRVPNLVQLLAEGLGMQVTADTDYAEHRHDEPAGVGSELADAASDLSLFAELNLQPVEIARSRQIGQLKRWLWAGAAAAMMMIAIDFVRYDARVSEARQQADALSTMATSTDALRLTEDRLRSAMAAMHRLESALDTEIGRSVELRAILHELSLLTPETIRFTSIAFNQVQGKLHGRLGGLAARSSEDSQVTELPEFITQIRNSPLVMDVVLGDVHSGGMHGTMGERFEAVLVGVPLLSDLPGQTPRTKPANASDVIASVHEKDRQ